jgi:AAHS family 4-hydroxybenzoate transporter-like MFS transporter
MRGSGVAIWCGDLGLAGCRRLLQKPFLKQRLGEGSGNRIMEGTLRLSELTERPGVSGLSKRVFLLCFLVMMADNYDNTAMAFSMPRLIHVWHIEQVTVGWIFSSGLFGLMVGSFLFGFLGDRFGRKKALIWGMIAFGILTLATMAASDVRQLMALRFLAGLGIGGALPNAVALVNEYAPRRMRVFVVAVIFAGYTLGGSGGGFVAAGLMPLYGWQVVFLVGGALPLLLACALAVLLPESVRFLALQPGRQSEALKLASALRPDLALTDRTRLVPDDEGSKPKVSIGDLFAGARRFMTPLLWLLYIANSMAVFAVTNWLPFLIESSGLPPTRAALGATLWSIGGTVGGLVASRLVDRYGLAAVTLFVLLGCPLTATLGVTGATPALLFGAVAVAGFFVVGTQNSLHGISGSIYPTRIRSNGVGWALGVAKIGSISGPFAVGLLLHAGLNTRQLFFTAAFPLAVAFVSAFFLMLLYDRHVHGKHVHGKASPAAAIGEPVARSGLAS